MGISLTEKAAEHIGSYLSSRGKGVGIRLSVKTTGCSGLMYVLEQLFKSQGIDVFVDPKSLIYVDGTEMDYVKQGLNEGFEFKNPNVQAECGCGESFTV
jgi:iron-sulfur cluster assembly protein